MNESDLIYWAGYFDGEGCVSFNGPPIAGPGAGTLRAAVKNTYLPELERLLAAFGGSICVNRNPPPRRTSFHWQVSGKKAATFLRAILPYAREKRPQIELGLALPAMQRLERVPHLAELKRLKRIDRGTAPTTTTIGEATQ